MKKRSLIAAALLASFCLACTMAVAATVAHKTATVANKTATVAHKKKPTPASRAAACRADCKTGGVHGAYRAYSKVDPELKSPEGRKLYAECVRLCSDPLPEFHIWKPIIESGGTAMGMTKAECLGCHAPGKPKRFWPGINTLPSALQR